MARTHSALTLLRISLTFIVSASTGKYVDGYSAMRQNTYRRFRSFQIRQSPGWCLNGQCDQFRVVFKKKAVWIKLNKNVYRVWFSVAISFKRYLEENWTNVHQNYSTSRKNTTVLLLASGHTRKHIQTIIQQRADGRGFYFGAVPYSESYWSTE